ncbi:MAG: protein kinase, partial [Pedobacter sp.]
LKDTTSVKISENLNYFPVELFDLVDTLEYLDLSSNLLETLPHDFYRFKKLKVFFASDNLFTVFPEVLGQCDSLDVVGFKSNRIESISEDALNPNLRWLILTNNKLKYFPESVGCCKRLEKLMLAGNQLTSLPEGLQYCDRLSLLRISANRLTYLPDWIFFLPNLCWLAFAGNSFKDELTYGNTAEIPFKELKIQELLGEGASGNIYKAERLSDNIVKDVAVKIFKGDVTSDGYPEDEMNAYIGSGEHPALVRLLGKVNLKQEKKSGLVMDLIPQSFFNLGHPPSLKTCTRDTFSDDNCISTEQLLEITTSMASIGAHLHSRGIMHGDLYAHNILINEAGKTLFGDFGAASFYDRNNEILAFYLERMEVKAYGFLLDDLLSICKINENHHLAEIGTLRDQCLLPELKMRPSFKEIIKKIALISAANY